MLTTPVAKRIPKTLSHLGHDRQDPYYWLSEKENPAVIAYLEEENAHKDAFMADTTEQQKALFDEMLGRIQETDLSVPEQDGPYYYYSRTEKGKAYPIHCRKQSLTAEVEEIIIDENTLAEGIESFNLGDYDMSEDHNLVAYTTDVNGSEKYHLFIKDLRTGEIIDDSLLEIDSSTIWGDNQDFIYYAKHDEAMRPYQLWKHKVGNDPSLDELLFEEADEAFYLGAGKSKSKRFIFLYLMSKVTTEVHYLDLQEKQTSFQLFEKRKHAVEYQVEHHSDQFYILTNENALNFKLMRTDIGKTASSNWEELFPYNPEVELKDLEVFKDHLVVFGRKNGFKSIHVLDLNTDHLQEVQFPEQLYTYWEGENAEFNSTRLRLTYSSLLTPRTVFDYDLLTGKFIELKKYEVVGAYDSSNYHMELHQAIAEDGTKIPISLVYRKDVVLDGSAPCLLYAYGSYSVSSDPYFSSSRFSLIDRGFVYAIAHIRGGGEKGRPWYEDGKFEKKKNSFTDFISTAEYLIGSQFTSPNKIVAMGGSAGGLLMGAVANMRPDLFKIISAHVPFVDVVTTMLDESLPLTVMEYDEWGNPNEEKFYRYMLSYSPYDQVEAKDYPSFLITAGLNDPRVSYWEPAKWCAKLRHLKTDDNPLLLKTNMGSGHQGKSGRYGYLEELAFEYAFFFKCLEISFGK
ncbi:S9 family peptidase [Chitinophagales bacterium]|nr:S9 family peptidase [Chitinophagales bacterium]